MIPELFPVFVVPDDAPVRSEAMGSKDKFWFSRNDERWLFKQVRPGQGEDWAEVLAAALADFLGLPRAHYELARWRGERGVVTRRFSPDGFDLVHGNELLAQGDPSYPREGPRYVRTPQHTIAAVAGVVGANGVLLPLDWPVPAGVQSPLDVFAGYLLLDAWIGNTDRHHQNWGLIVRRSDGSRFLAPTFDHASSLGANLREQERARRLAARDPAFRVEAYVRRPKVRSALFLNAGDAQPLGLVDAFLAWSRSAPTTLWTQRLAAIETPEVDALVGRVPSGVMSGPAKDFARAMLSATRRRILESAA